MKRKIALDLIDVSSGTQIREHIDDDVINEYAEHIADLPPIDVFDDGQTVWETGSLAGQRRYLLGEGFHRYFAHRKKDKSHILCTVHKGGLREAILFACGVNQTHGLRRTNADKRNAVVHILGDDEWSKWSDSKIAETCGVSHPFVGEVRRSLVTVTGHESTKRLFRTRHGTLSEMNTARIGRGNQKPDDTKRVDEPRKQAVKDVAGNRLPDHLIAAYRCRDEITGFLDEIEEVGHKLEIGIGSKAFPLGKQVKSELKEAIKKCRNVIWLIRPHAMCPACAGKGCKQCGSVGLVNEPVYRRLIAGATA